MSTDLISSWNHESNQNKSKLMNFVEHPGGSLTIHDPSENIPPNIFNLRHQFRFITTEQMEVLQRTTWRDVQKILSQIWNEKSFFPH